ncbi:histidine protein methyltransferase 1 homolog [Argiope bruennichi]|uniref:histidine protein methyltransferase 1 homolog n=1 Tax=Argiope bruennichi TaxID=94029 RepID=UPI0024951758|nr:histidine protein methyltransferase 1 homolog [Argiope bruennichi]
MSFCFNFPHPSNGQAANSANTDISSVKILKETCNHVPCEFILGSDFDFKVVQEINPKKQKFAGIEIKYITQDIIAKEIDKLDVFSEKTSDLIPGKYEGGLKVWECSIDLAQYLAENSCIQENDFVLELGCGIGLPGLVAYLCGGLVTFQDYNSEVLKLLTAPNVCLNTAKENQLDILQKCQFLCGDWHDIKEIYYSEEKERKLYDVILTSETIYERSNQGKLLNLMKAALKPGGVIYLASKIHYFGVGGNIADFEELLKEDKTFNYSTVFEIKEGVERRILKMTRQTS